jgi:glycogen operon protein
VTRYFANIETAPGQPLPLGANIVKDGVRFSIFSRNAASVSLFLFESTHPDSNLIELKLDPVINRTGEIWHILIKNISAGQLYGYKIDGPYDPLKGHHFNSKKLLIDPYARAISGDFIWDLSKCRDSLNVNGHYGQKSEIDSAPYVPKCIVIADDQGIDDKPIKIPHDQSIIYELHVKGFTRHPSSEVEHPGTYKGLIEKIPYLKELGVTSVELMPVQDFDDRDIIYHNPITGEKLSNYWGYNTITFFAPKGGYSASGSMGEQVREFKEMVKALHDAGIEVILDVVFNHTSEGDSSGPMLSFRGIDNIIYYILNENKGEYANYSGCGNTFNCNHPLVRNFILDALRYWVIEMHVDGFRFDLASILGRGQNGEIISNPPLIERIEEDPILRNTKLIAEAWDAAGAYHLGKFPDRWAEWNGKYRDDVRRFWKGDKNTAGYFATRITGSSDLYSLSANGPLRSINFITCHDGFTLNDLVTYSRKHNEANGENNQDGENFNHSSNWGIEGETDLNEINTIRLRMIKNFIATLFLSQGVPMLLAGDEFRRTQLGNNNAYCQDNEISWINWRLMNENQGLLRFTREMIAFRKANPAFRRSKFFDGGEANIDSIPDASWHGTKPFDPDWSISSHAIALLINGKYSEEVKNNRDYYCVFNASDNDLFFILPLSPSKRPWRLAIDTSQKSPDDIHLPGQETEIAQDKYLATAKSTVVLLA